LVAVAALMIIATVGASQPQPEQYPEGPEVDERPYPMFVERSALLPRYTSFVPMPHARSQGGPFAFLKRGVMMGVDLPDFILNHNQGSSGTKNIQALRQRLFQSGRRR